MSQNWTATNKPVAIKHEIVGFRSLGNNTCRILTEKLKLPV